MRIAINELPEGVEMEVDGNRAVITCGDPEAPVVASVLTDGTHLILFPERSYSHADLATALGFAS